MNPELLKELRRTWDELAAIRSRLNKLEKNLEAIMSEDALRAMAPPAPPPPPPELNKLAATASPPPLPASAPVARPLPKTTAASHPPKPAISFEQRVGVSWLSKIGVVVLILGAVFFFQHAVQMGWIVPKYRCHMGALAGLILLALGERCLRKGARILSGGMTGGGIALWYVSTYAAWNFYQLIGTPTAFALMCATTVAAVLLSLRSGMISIAILGQIGAYLTPLLLSTGQNRQHELMIYLLVMAVGFLLFSAIRRWGVLSLISLAGTILVFGLWFGKYGNESSWEATLIYAWVLLASFLAYAGAATAAGLVHQRIGIAVTAGAGAGLVLLLAMIPHITSDKIFGHLLALDAAVLALCLWRRWHWLRAGCLAWTTWVIINWGYILFTHAIPAHILKNTLYDLHFSIWTWIFFVIFTADILIRAWRTGRLSPPALDGWLSAIATGGMFAATYGLLNERHHAWMGGYTASLALAAFILTAILHRTGRRALGYSYLAQGLVLLTLAMPIQFDKYTLTISWAAQAVVIMLLARRLPNRTMLATAPIVLLLAVIHYFSVDVPQDDRLAQTLLCVGGTDINGLLVLAVGLATSAFVSAALVAVGPPLASKNKGDDRIVAGMLAVTGALVWLVQTAWQLPALAATWWWLALAVGIACAGFGRRSRWLASIGLTVLLLTTVKYVLADTLVRTLTETAEHHWTIALNWQFAAGVAIAAACAVAGRCWAACLDTTDRPGPVRPVAELIAAFMILWAGSFEVHRFFDSDAARMFTNPGLAQQMGYSVWWSVFAAVLLCLGFLARRRALRYMSLTIFGVALLKVLVIDMAGVGLAYRIGSFLALGVLLVAASFLYQRFFSHGATKRNQVQ